MTYDTFDPALLPVVDLENAYNDGKELADPSYQLLAVEQYREQYITGLLDQARHLLRENNALKRQLADANGHLYPGQEWCWQRPPAPEGGNSTFWEDEPF